MPSTAPQPGDRSPKEVQDLTIRRLSGMDSEMLKHGEAIGPVRSLDLQLIEYEPIAKLLAALPIVGQNIAKRHLETLDEKYPGPEYAEAKSVIRRLAENPYDLIAHDPKWHQWSIPEHSENVVKVAFHMLIHDLNNQQESVQKAVRHLQEKSIDGVSLFKLFLISIPLHDIGKYQPIIKPADEKEGIRSGHTGHEARSGDIIKQISSHNCAGELYELKNIFSQSQINSNHLAFIEQCARLHYEFGKVREAAKKSSGGYNLAFVASQEFSDACNDIASEHSFELNIIKGLYFIVDTLGKMNTSVISAYMRMLEVNPEKTDKILVAIMEQENMPAILKGAVQQFPVNRAVALQFLNFLFSKSL